MRILFMGTPDFATVCLDALITNGFDVVGVVTKTDTKQGRGMKVNVSDVKKYATAHELPVYQPETFRDGAFEPTLKAINPDIIVVVAYGKILPPYVLDYPEYGCVNVHGSLLPAYRGAAPIQRAVLDGQKESGVATMKMDVGMDTGDVYDVARMPIGENMTTGELFDALAELGGKLLVKTLRDIENGTATAQEQIGEPTYAAKLAPEEAKLDFSRTAYEVHNKIRGMSPFPGASALLDGKSVKLYDSTVENADDVCGEAGSVLCADKSGVVIACGTGALRVRAFKPEGKGKMTAADMVNGRKIAAGMRFV